MNGLNPTSRILNIPFETPQQGHNPLWLLTPEEISSDPTDASLMLESILGERRPWASLKDADLETRDFRYQGQQVIKLTAWGIRLPMPAQPL